MRKLSVVMIILLLFGSVAFFVLRFFALRTLSPSRDFSKLFVVATIYPYGDIAKSIGGDAVEVAISTPPGIEPHEFTPTLRQREYFASADLFIKNGGGIDAWADDLTQDVQTHDGTVLDVAARYGLENNDPHIWLDPVMAEKIAADIRDAFQELDPEHAKDFAERFSAFDQDLQSLMAEYDAGLQTCSLEDILVSHDAYHYLAKRYTITVHSILNVSEEDEPSAQELARMIELAKTLGIQTIFTEPLSTGKLEKTIARELGGTVLVLDPIENILASDDANATGYLSLMRENLSALKTAMMCP